MLLEDIIKNALLEDIGEADHTTLACVSANKTGKAKLLIKENGILAGIHIAQQVFKTIDKSLKVDVKIIDGSAVKKGDIAFLVQGSLRSIITAERLVLNILQRMSGIATSTNAMVKLIGHTNTILLDTRKTTPGVRLLEKMAVKIGGAQNHRFGLYDMILIKDNHVDAAGGINNAIDKTIDYLKRNNLSLKIEIEVRSFNELHEVLEHGGINRILIDNFSINDLKKAVAIVDGRFETEASGMINNSTILDFAATGVDYISCGALTHQVRSLDMSLKIIND